MSTPAVEFALSPVLWIKGLNQLERDMGHYLLSSAGNGTV